MSSEYKLILNILYGGSGHLGFDEAHEGDSIIENILTEKIGFKKGGIYLFWCDNIDSAFNDFDGIPVKDLVELAIRKPSEDINNHTFILIRSADLDHPALIPSLLLLL